MDETKFCIRCQQVLSISKFIPRPDFTDGLHSYCRACHNKLATAGRKQRRLDLLTAMGSRCVRCGFSDFRALQIDHIHGGGRKELSTVNATTASYYRKVLANPVDYQLLCGNCQWIKRYENDENRGSYNRVPPVSKRESKYCPKCELQVPIEEWVRNKGRKDGLSVYCRSCHNSLNNERKRQRRLDLLAAMGGKCERCEVADPRVLQVDHVHGGGQQEMRVLNSSTARYYKKVLASPDEYVLLCVNHNWIKREEENEAAGKLNPVHQIPTDDRPRRQRKVTVV